MTDPVLARGWEVLPPCALIFEQFDQEFAVYNRLSGETHFLNESASGILKVLQEHPEVACKGMNAIAPLFGLGQDEQELIGQLAGILSEFEQTGLICQFPA